MTVTFLGTEHECSTAIKGEDYVHLLDANGLLTASFEKVVDFSVFTLSGGSWTSPTAEDECHLAVVGDDGVVRKSGSRTADFAKSSHGTHVTYATAAPKVAGTAAVGSSSKVAREDHVHPPQTTINGHTVESNVPANAKFTDTVYTHPSGTAKTGNPTANQTPAFGGTFTVTQFTSDATGHITGATDRTVKIPNTTMTAATASAAGKIGLVPAPAAGAQGKFLRGDGTWQTPTNTTYGNASATAAGLVSTGAQTFAGVKTFSGGAVIGTNASPTLAQCRDIYAGTTDMTAGTSALTTGAIYLVYE